MNGKWESGYKEGQGVLWGNGQKGEKNERQCKTTRGKTFQMKIWIGDKSVRCQHAKTPESPDVLFPAPVIR